MSKFKVGDKVWVNGDVKVIKRVDEWENGEYGYYFNVDDDLLDFYEERDLELYKTPHERLLELGWRLEHENEYGVYYCKYSTIGTITISTIRIYKKEKTYQTYSYNPINLELAEILVDYLRELENE